MDGGVPGAGLRGEVPVGARAGVHLNINCLQDFFENDKLSKKVRDTFF